MQVLAQVAPASCFPCFLHAAFAALPDSAEWKLKAGKELAVVLEKEDGVEHRILGTGPAVRMSYAGYN